MNLHDEMQQDITLTYINYCTFQTLFKAKEELFDFFLYILLVCIELLRIRWFHRNRFLKKELNPLGIIYTLYFPQKKGLLKRKQNTF